MKFIVGMPNTIDLIADTAYLVKSSWNDYGYYTKYTLMYCENPSNIIEVGNVNIGEFNMTGHHFSTELPSEFEKLNLERFFSFSISEMYYMKLVGLNNDRGYDILFALNDFTVCRDVYEKAKNENVTRCSLFRDIPEKMYDNYVNKYYQLLQPPLNLTTMRRIYGSTGWEDVDNGLVEMQRLLFNANIHYYYNAIATIGREIIIGVTDKIYDDEIHRDKAKYSEPPNYEQYINKLCGYVDYSYSKRIISEDMKSYIKSTIKLVNGYVHKNEAEGFESFMCVHAVISLVYQLTILYNKNKYNEVST